MPTPAYLKSPPPLSTLLCYYLLFLLTVICLFAYPRRARPCYLVRLPPELHQEITTHLAKLNDIACFARSTRQLYGPVRHILLQRAARTPTGIAKYANWKLRILIYRPDCPLLARSPLHAAAAAGATGLVKEMLARGADPLQHDFYDHTALVSAVIMDRVEVVRLLAAHEHTFRCVLTPHAEWTPLALAIAFGHHVAARALLDARATGGEHRVVMSTPLAAPVEMPGYTALGIAVAMDDAAAVAMLVAAGCAVANVGPYGIGAAEMAGVLGCAKAGAALGVAVGERAECERLQELALWDVTPWNMLSTTCIDYLLAYENLERCCW